MKVHLFHTPDMLRIHHLALGLASIVTFLAPSASAELSGSVGPLTTADEKAAVKTCNVLDYGAVADNSTDVGQPIIDAFADCGSGGLIYVPEGNYSFQTWVSLSDGNAWALRIDGVLWRDDSPASQAYMLEISGGSDFELFSSNSEGAFQGSGYLYHKEGTYTGPRILHISGVSDWSVHDFILVDSPMFHFVIDGDSSNGEVYNMAIRGGDAGGLDGIDVSATNTWIHDVRALFQFFALLLFPYEFHQRSSMLIIVNTGSRSPSPIKMNVSLPRYECP